LPSIEYSVVVDMVEILCQLVINSKFTAELEGRSNGRRQLLICAVDRIVILVQLLNQTNAATLNHINKILSFFLDVGEQGCTGYTDENALGLEQLLSQIQIIQKHDDLSTRLRQPFLLDIIVDILAMTQVFQLIGSLIVVPGKSFQLSKLNRLDGGSNHLVQINQHDVGIIAFQVLNQSRLPTLARNHDA